MSDDEKAKELRKLLYPNYQKSYETLDGASLAATRDAKDAPVIGMLGGAGASDALSDLRAFKDGAVGADAMTASRDSKKQEAKDSNSNE